MKIAIIGTRGIPNNYGGFEQFAEFLSVGLVKKGHEVYVYNSHNHLYKEDLWNGVHIIHKYDPEHKAGTVGQFIYDLNCIVDSRKRNFDIILNLGYTSSSVWSRIFPKKPLIITNMDGLEWKRTKFSEKVKRFLKYAEKLAVKHSDVLIADSKAIQAYIYENHQKTSHFIAYGATLFSNPDPTVLQGYALKEHTYSMLIARMEPENNIETILDGVHKSQNPEKFLVVGNPTNKFGTYLSEKYKDDERIIFTGAIYDLNKLNNLRYYCRFYFHGHSVGGTNPSLLEAMACACLVAAHNNPFNQSVLEDHALYFENPKDVSDILDQADSLNQKDEFAKINIEKIKTLYSWENIINAYESVMIQEKATK